MKHFSIKLFFLFLICFSCSNLFSTETIKNICSAELIYFKAVAGSNRIVLNWTTVSEINNDYFTVEKSIDGVEFEKVEKMDGAGNSSSKLNYSIIDNYPYFGVSYYRLKQTNFDGTFSYSNMVAVEFTDEGIADFNVFPNPSEGLSVNVSITAEKDKEILVEVFDINGKKTFSKVVITDSEGKNVHAIDFTHKLIPGVYFISATSNQSIYNKRLIVK